WRRARRTGGPVRGRPHRAEMQGRVTPGEGSRVVSRSTENLRVGDTLAAVQIWLADPRAGGRDAACGSRTGRTRQGVAIGPCTTIANDDSYVKTVHPDAASLCLSFRTLVPNQSIL